MKYERLIGALTYVYTHRGKKIYFFLSLRPRKTDDNIEKEQATLTRFIFFCLKFDDSSLTKKHRSELDGRAIHQASQISNRINLLVPTFA